MKHPEIVFQIRYLRDMQWLFIKKYEVLDQTNKNVMDNRNYLGEGWEYCYQAMLPEFPLVLGHSPLVNHRRPSMRTWKIIVQPIKDQSLETLAYLLEGKFERTKVGGLGKTTFLSLMLDFLKI